MSGFDESERPPIRSSIGRPPLPRPPVPPPLDSSPPPPPAADEFELRTPPATDLGPATVGPGTDLGPASPAPLDVAPKPAESSEAQTKDEEPEDTHLLDLPAPPKPVWLDRLALLLLAPLILGGGNPLMVVIIAIEASRQLMWLEPWMAITAGLSLVTIPSFSGLALLIHRSASYRRVVVDDHGFVFGKTDKWRGTRVAWEAVVGFQTRSDGLMLKLKGKPWTRWLGPIVHSQDRETHELVVALEARGIYRLGSE